MSSNRQLFLNYLAQTSPSPLLLEIQSAKDIYLYDTSGQSYMDLISGISVSNLGHQHPAILRAIHRQTDEYMHIMVYGEMVLSPQVRLATKLCSLLPSVLNNCYFVNSGSEAVEGALKLAKRHTGRHEIIAFRNGYHGSTAGALSLMSNEEMKTGFRPLTPGIRWIDFNHAVQLDEITEKTAAVIFEFVQAEAGAIEADPHFIKMLRHRCSQTGTLLIADEIQTAMRRTGKLFAFEDYDLVPDILILAKAFGGGMPLGAFVANRSVMECLALRQPLGHITTFGGHPVSCAAALASLDILTAMTEEEVRSKENLFRQLLVHPSIIRITGKGLLLGIEFENPELCQQIIRQCVRNGILTDWFLFAPQKMRIAPPLIITGEEIATACSLILKSIDQISNLNNQNP